MNPKLKIAFKKQCKVYLSWSAWFLSIFFAIFLVVNALSIWWHGEISWQLFQGAYVSSQIFFLIVGLLSAGGFLTHYVSNGLTRKAYFKSISLAGACGSMLLTIMIATLQLLVSGFLALTGLDSLYIESIEHPMTVASVSYLFLALFLYFLIGWLVSLGFYRHWLLGSVFIIAALVVMMVVNHAGLFLTAGNVILSIVMILALLLKLRLLTAEADVKP